LYSKGKTGDSTLPMDLLESSQFLYDEGQGDLIATLALP
jgi:hypothetical protein